MAQERIGQRRRGNLLSTIGILVAALVAWLFEMGRLPAILNQTDGRSAVQAGVVAVDERSSLQPVPNPVPDVLWKFDMTGLVRYDAGNVSVSPDNDLITGFDAGNVTPQSTVVVRDFGENPDLGSFLPNRDWVVNAHVEALLKGPRDGAKSVVTMLITPLNNPRVVPVPEG